jgi:hypothetical protein
MMASPRSDCLPESTWPEPNPNSHPGRVQAIVRRACTSPVCGVIWGRPCDRWCRFAQPPATGLSASGANSRVFAIVPLPPSPIPATIPPAQTRHVGPRRPH